LKGGVKAHKARPIMSMPTSICTGPKGLAVYRIVELYFLINQKVTIFWCCPFSFREGNLIKVV
jgi:hypothetical protein